MSFKHITREFAGDIGQRSRGTASPNSIENDLDRLIASLNPDATITFPDGTTRVGGLHAENFSSTIAFTDANIGPRTINDGLTGGADAGTLTQLLSWLAKMIRTCTGKPDWLTPPVKSLEALNAELINIVLDQIPNGTVTDFKLSDDAGMIKKSYAQYKHTQQINKLMGGL